MHYALKIYGTDYATAHGKWTRGYVCACDLVNAHMLGLKSLVNGIGRRIFLGTGQGLSVYEIIERSELITNQVVSKLEGPWRDGDCTKLIFVSVHNQV